jgi:sec-independent protein translocase protein TatA
MVVAEIFSPDILIVLVVIAVLFGGAKLPKLARSLGSAKGEFEKGLRDGAEAAAADDPKPEAKPAKAAETKAIEASADSVVDTTGTVAKGETTA